MTEPDPNQPERVGRLEECGWQPVGRREKSDPLEHFRTHPSDEEWIVTPEAQECQEFVIEYRRVSLVLGKHSVRMLGILRNYPVAMAFVSSTTSGVSDVGFL